MKFPKVSHPTMNIDGLDIFYREAGLTFGMSSRRATSSLLLDGRVVDDFFILFLSHDGPDQAAIDPQRRRRQGLHRITPLLKIATPFPGDPLLQLRR